MQRYRRKHHTSDCNYKCNRSRSTGSVIIIIMASFMFMFVCLFNVYCVHIFKVLAAVKYITTRETAGNAENENSIISSCCPSTFCLRFPTRKGLYLQPMKPDSRSRDCYVCNKTQLTLEIDTNINTLAFFIEKVIFSYIYIYIYYYYFLVDWRFGYVYFKLNYSFRINFRC